MQKLCKIRKYHKIIQKAKLINLIQNNMQVQSFRTKYIGKMHDFMSSICMLSLALDPPWFSCPAIDPACPPVWSPPSAANLPVFPPPIHLSSDLHRQSIVQSTGNRRLNYPSPVNCPLLVNGQRPHRFLLSSSNRRSISPPLVTVAQPRNGQLSLVNDQRSLGQLLHL